MTTIANILTEALNRVKAEHGVTLSTVEFSGNHVDYNTTGDDTGYKPPVEIDATEWGLTL